jgi:hypothetical protein
MKTLKILRKDRTGSIEVPTDTVTLRVNEPVSELANLAEVIQSLPKFESLDLYVTDYGKTDLTQSLEFLRGAKRLKNLSISSMTQLRDCSALLECHGLKWLSLNSDVSKNFDFNILPSLHSLSSLSVGMPNISVMEQIAKASQLASLEALGGFKLASLEPLAGLKNLQKLKLWGGSLMSCRGLSAFDELEELNLGYSKVRDTTELGSVKNLKSMQLIGNKTISDLEFFREGNLEKLGLFEIPKLNSLKPLLRLSKLKAIDCTARIADGDLLPLTNHPKLEKAAIAGRYKAGLKKIRVDSGCVFRVGHETLKLTRKGPLVLETATEAKERIGKLIGAEKRKA